MIAHARCHEMAPMDFPPLHFYSPICSGCNVEFFFESGESTAWAFVFGDLMSLGGIESIPSDEWRFYRDLYNALRKAAEEWIESRIEE